MQLDVNQWKASIMHLSRIWLYVDLKQAEIVQMLTCSHKEQILLSDFIFIGLLKHSINSDSNLDSSYKHLGY